MIAYAGLEPVLRLAERCDLDGLVDEHVAITEIQVKSVLLRGLDVLASTLSTPLAAPGW